MPSDGFSDANLGNPSLPPEPPEPFWIHCAGGLHMGRMSPRVQEGEFGAVLTVAATAGNIDPALRHRHIPISYVNTDYDAVGDAVLWVLDQFYADRSVLVRSEGGLQRPGLIIAIACMRLGATKSEALYCVRRRRLQACTDFRYLNFIDAMWQVMEATPEPGT